MNAILLKKTLRDMGKSRGQSIALVIIVAIGVASFVGMIDGYRDLGSSYESTYERLSLADVTYQLQSAPESAVEGVSSIDGVRAVTGRLIYDTGLAVQSASAEKTQVRARLIGIPAGDHPEVDDVLVTEGDYLPAGNASSALVESHFAKAWGLRPGDTIHPLVNGRQTDLRIAGIAASPEYLIVSASRQDILPNPRAFAVLFVPRDALQKEFEAEDTVNNIAVLLEPGADKAVVSARIRSALEPYGIAETTLQKDQPSVAALRLDLEGYRQIGFLMPTLILLAAAASLFVMLGRQVRAQRVQIGLMKAVGTARASIALHYLGLSFLIAAIGAIAGVAAGYPLGVLITTEYAAELGIPLVRTHLYPDVVAGGFAVSLLAAVIAGIFPARRAARLAPAAAMRPDPAQALTGGGRSLFDRLIPLPLWARLSARNVFRVPSRSVSTLVGVIFAFILVISSWAMIDSMQKIIADNFINVERWDVQATFQFPRSMDSLSDITSRPGVLRAEPVLRMPATLHGAPGAPAETEDVLLQAVPPDADLHAIHPNSGASLADVLRPGDILMTRTIMDKLGLRVGDTVSVGTPLGDRRLVVGDTADELMSAVAYVSLDTATGWIPGQFKVFNSLYITADPDRAKELKDYLFGLPGASSAELKSTVRSSWESLLGLFYALMGVVILFALAMAFALIFNAMTVNVLEQQRELATMRSVGTGGGRIALMLIVENLILWLIALVPGLVLGTLTARGMGAEFQSDLFGFSIFVSPNTYLVTSAGVLVTMILAIFPAVRRVGRLNLAMATKVLT